MSTSSGSSHTTNSNRHNSSVRSSGISTSVIFGGPRDLLAVVQQEDVDQSVLDKSCNSWPSRKSSSSRCLSLDRTQVDDFEDEVFPESPSDDEDFIAANIVAPSIADVSIGAECLGIIPREDFSAEEAQVPETSELAESRVDNETNISVLSQTVVEDTETVQQPSDGESTSSSLFITPPLGQSSPKKRRSSNLDNPSPLNVSSVSHQNDGSESHETPIMAGKCFLDRSGEFVHCDPDSSRETVIEFEVDSSRSEEIVREVPYQSPRKPEEGSAVTVAEEIPCEDDDAAEQPYLIVEYPDSESVLPEGVLEADSESVLSEGVLEAAEEQFVSTDHMREDPIEPLSSGSEKSDIDAVEEHPEQLTEPTIDSDGVGGYIFGYETDKLSQHLLNSVPNSSIHIQEDNILQEDNTGVANAMEIVDSMLCDGDHGGYLTINDEAVKNPGTEPKIEFREARVQCTSSLGDFHVPAAPAASEPRHIASLSLLADFANSFLDVAPQPTRRCLIHSTLSLMLSIRTQLKTLPEINLDGLDDAVDELLERT